MQTAYSRMSSWFACLHRGHGKGDVPVKQTKEVREELREKDLPKAVVDETPSITSSANNVSVCTAQLKTEDTDKVTGTRKKVGAVIDDIVAVHSNRRMEQGDAGVQLVRRREPMSTCSLLDDAYIEHQRLLSATDGSDTSPQGVLFQQILNTVGELEDTFFSEHHYDFKLRVALEEQMEAVRNLELALEKEKQRNERLVKLMRGMDNGSSADDEVEDLLHPHGNKPHAWQGNAFESISPLLMQQRYEELSESHNQCRRQLSKKERHLRQAKCDNETLKAKYDTLMKEFRLSTKRCEGVCIRFLKLRAKKHHEIQLLKFAIMTAIECVNSARNAVFKKDNQTRKEFTQNVQTFMHYLSLINWFRDSPKPVPQAEPQPHTVVS